jgi:hypothetical protein
MASMDMEGLQASGWRLPGSQFDDGQQAVGQRVFVAGIGIGLITGFNRATVGTSSHLVRLDDNGLNVDVKLERKGNRQTRWLLAPASAATVLDGGGGGSSESEAILPLLLARPPDLVAHRQLLPDSAELLCHFCDVRLTLEVADLLLQELVVACGAASRLLSAVQPGIVRAELEAAVLSGDSPRAATPLPAAEKNDLVARTVLERCGTFAKSKSSFGGMFSKEKKPADASPELLDACRLAWPSADRMALARWLQWALDPPAGESRNRSCWCKIADEGALAVHQAACGFRPCPCPYAVHGCTGLLNAKDAASRKYLSTPNLPLIFP